MFQSYFVVSHGLAAEGSVDSRRKGENAIFSKYASGPTWAYLFLAFQMSTPRITEVPNRPKPQPALFLRMSNLPVDPASVVDSDPLHTHR